MIEGSSNYAFNIILKKPDFQLAKKLINLMKNNGIEFRRGSAGGGNQLRQPYIQKFIEHEYWKNFPVTDHIHFFGFYLGNFPELSFTEIDEILEILNSI